MSVGTGRTSGGHGGQASDEPDYQIQIQNYVRFRVPDGPGRTSSALGGLQTTLSGRRASEALGGHQTVLGGRQAALGGRQTALGGSGAGGRHAKSGVCAVLGRFGDR